MFEDSILASEAKPPASAKNENIYVSYAAAVFLGFLILYFVLGFFDHSTELTPDHEGTVNACFAIAAASGLATASLVFAKTAGQAVWRRVWTAFCFLLLGCISVFLVASRVSEIVNMLIDFPPAKTRTFTGFLRISRAYQTHGKGASRNIQTTPFWSNLEVTKNDYGFMLAHRRPGDSSTDVDEISSKGYFCARVVAQQSGNALRIMHAGSETLPDGTVMLCPPLP